MPRSQQRLCHTPRTPDRDARRRTVSNQLFEVAWRKLETTLKGKHVQFVAIDGASPDMKEVRSALWAISGKREYPQVFVKKAFMGGMDELQEALDTGSFQQTYGEFVDLDAVTPR